MNENILLLLQKILEHFKTFWLCLKDFGLHRNVPLLPKKILEKHLTILASFQSL
jgi:hypothetical protein